MKGLKIDSDDATMELGNLDLQLDSDDLINLKNLDDEMEKLPQLDNLSIKLNLEDYSIPRQLTKEMDLDDIGIREIEGNKLSLEISKDDDDLNVDFEINTDNIGEISLESEMDFSKNKKDPFLNLEISLDNLNEDFSKILKRTKFEEKGENNFRFKYEGNLKDIQKSIK